MTYITRTTTGIKTTANSISVTLANDHYTILVNDSQTKNAVDGVYAIVAATVGAVNEALPSSDTPSNASVHGLTMRVAYNVGLMSAKLPATLGAKTTANSMAVTMASDQAAIASKVADGDNIAFGATTATAATTNTGTFSFMAFFKWFLTRTAVAIDTDNAVLTNTKVLPVGGVARVPGSLTPYAGGDAALMTLNADDGSVYVNQGDLSPRYDGVTFSEAIKIFSFEITRPANTTAYTAEDIIMDNAAGALNFLNVSSSLSTADSSGYIVKARIVTDDPNTIGKRISLLLYDSSGTYTLTDNTPWTGGGYAQEINKICEIPFTIADVPGDPVSTDAAACELNDLRIAYKLVNSVNFRIGFLTKDVFTPASGSKFFVQITVSINP